MIPKETKMFKILVVDDDLSNAEAIQMVLEHQNYTVESIHRSDLLKPAIKSFQPDLIVMDILLDTNDGRDLCNSIKCNAETKHIPIMLITAMLESQVNSIQCEADAIMFKPFDYSRLNSKVRGLIRLD